MQGSPCCCARFTHLEWSPLQPNGFGQWFALFLLIFPAAAAAELLGERLLGKRALGRGTSRRPRATSDCSWTPRGRRHGGRAARHHRRRDGRGLVAVASGGQLRRFYRLHSLVPSGPEAVLEQRVQRPESRVTRHQRGAPLRLRLERLDHRLLGADLGSRLARRPPAMRGAQRPARHRLRRRRAWSAGDRAAWPAGGPRSRCARPRPRSPASVARPIASSRPASASRPAGRTPRPR